MNILEEKIAEYNFEHTKHVTQVYYDPRKNKQLERYNPEFQKNGQQKYDEYMEYAETTLNRCGTIESYMGENQSPDISTITIVHTEFGPIKRIIYNNADTCYEGIYQLKDEENQTRMQYVYYYNDYNKKKTSGVLREDDGTFVYINEKHYYAIKHYFSNEQDKVTMGNSGM